MRKKQRFGLLGRLITRSSMQSILIVIPVHSKLWRIRIEKEIESGVKYHWTGRSKAHVS